MKTTITRIGTAALCMFAFSLAVASPRSTASASLSARPRVIEIRARKFEFSPRTIILKNHEPVILRLISEDRIHGFLSRPLKIDTDISPSQATDVAVLPDTVGEYSIICDHYCGIGHGQMKLKVTIVE